MKAGKPRAAEAGFTLVEILVVLLIVAIVVSIALVNLMNAFDKTKQRATMADMRTISKAIETYMVDHSVPPTGSGDITALVTVLTPYHSTVLPVVDHWRNTYTYASNGADLYTIESHGKDGLNGGDVTILTRFDFDLDIVLSNGVFVAAPE